MVPTAVPRLLPENGSLLGGIAQITPNLFLSRGNVASNRSLLLSKGITCVVNATIELPNFNWPHMEYVKVPLADMPHSPISLYFDSVADKIHSVGRKRGAVLVHCAAGVSRSASLCLAYLMKYHRVSLAEAHAWVKARRPVIRPNGGFWRQLIEYERKLFGRNSVKMVQTPYGVIPDVYERDRRSLAPYWGLLQHFLQSEETSPPEMPSDVTEPLCHSFSFAVATEQQADIDEHHLSCAHTSEGPAEWSPRPIPLPTETMTDQPLRGHLTSTKQSKYEQVLQVAMNH
uniref:Dual-specificity phosphatase 14a n=1 Tax=Paralichthys olivaceus TaxID=8255 RepID=A0A9E9M663_PAROL|nr:dual-specificity phosphatase 14a [Paralichthys olivaceus]